jgi:hypothetical protein
MLEREQRRDFVQRWWPAHVTLHVPKKPGLHEEPLVTVDTHRAFVLRVKSGLVIMAASSLVRGHSRVKAKLHDGRTVWAVVPRLAPDDDPPLMALTWESGTAPVGLDGLAWSVQPELGPGRHAWALERPFDPQPRTEWGRPILVETALTGVAFSPLDRYWRVSLRSAIGAPLLDAHGGVLCVLFRRWIAEPGTSLCVTEGDATRSLAP